MFLGFTARLLLDVNNTIFPILPTTSACKVFSTRKGRGNDISERAALALLRVHGTHSGFVGLHSASRWTGSIYFFFPKWMFKQTERQRNTYRRTAQNQITEQPILGFSISLRCLMRCVSAATLRI